MKFSVKENRSRWGYCLGGGKDLGGFILSIKMDFLFFEKGEKMVRKFMCVCI